MGKVYSARQTILKKRCSYNFQSEKVYCETHSHGIHLIEKLRRYDLRPGYQQEIQNNPNLAEIIWFPLAFLLARKTHKVGSALLQRAGSAAKCSPRSCAGASEIIHLNHLKSW